MTGYLNKKSRSIINVKQAQAHNYQNYQKYVNNRLNLSVGGAHVDGVKQAATSLYLYVFLTIKWVMVMKMKPNSGSQDQITQFLMIHISQCVVRN